MCIRDRLATGQHGVGRWLHRFQPAPVDFADWPALFRNLNTPEDWAALAADDDSLPSP